MVGSWHFLGGQVRLSVLAWLTWRTAMCQVFIWRQAVQLPSALCLQHFIARAGWRVQWCVL